MYEILDEKSTYVSPKGKQFSPNEAKEVIDRWEAEYSGVPLVIAAFRSVYKSLEDLCFIHGMIEIEHNKLKDEKNDREAKAEKRRTKSTKRTDE